MAILANGPLGLARKNDTRLAISLTRRITVVTAFGLSIA